MRDIKQLINTIIWGFILWLIGYLAGIILFFIVPKEYIGWIITPIAIIFTVWVLLKRIKRPKLMSYLGISLIWTVLAVILDFIFIFKLLNAGTEYYKPDVFLYYILTFSLPILVGNWKFKHKPSEAKLF